MSREVQVECLCPPKEDGGPRHEADTITLRERLDFRTTIAARKEIAFLKEEQPSAAEVLAMLSEFYLLHGIDSWSLSDSRDKPLPLSRENVRVYLLSHVETAMSVADVADELYTEAVVLPLLKPVGISSPPMPTDGSTYPTNGSGPKHRKRSRPSSTSTTRTVATART